MRDGGTEGKRVEGRERGREGGGRGALPIFSTEFEASLTQLGSRSGNVQVMLPLDIRLRCSVPEHIPPQIQYCFT